ncbi:origin of replication complex subunit 3 isoform X2 [Primulina eburnea]|uniref:origin of replication complex subunit 3 isoform X2 n=1 Tax=Primulina eburnea TaxID=1245227 RepID=UPI003C6C2F10
MSPAGDPLVPPPIYSADNNNLQPFFVLHQATQTRKSTGTIRRRIDLSSKTSDANEKDTAKGYDDNARLKNFRFLWSEIESTITDVLRNVNAGVFEKIDEWVRKSFHAIRVCWVDPISAIQKKIHCPVLNRLSFDSAVASRKLFTALVFTKNMEFVDDIVTFVDLGVHLRTHGCHVANLTSLDFSAKNGVGGCLKTLLRQFLMVDIDAPDISALASWYTESENYGSPLVVIIDNVERCSGSVLADFIILLSEWAIKIPTILIVGVATTVDLLRNTLSSNACSRISSCEFTLGTPAERMDAIIEAVLLKHSGSFSVGKQVISFLRSYFLHHDGTLTFFVRALKISMAQQIYAEHLSFLLTKIADEDTKCFGGESILSQETVVKQALDLPSIQRFCQSSSGDDVWVFGWSKLKAFRNLWNSMVMFLYEVGKYQKITLLDLYCEMLEHEPWNSKASDNCRLATDNRQSSLDEHLLASLQKGGCVHRAIQIVRDLSGAEMAKLLKSWEILSRGITEIHEKVKELQSLVALEDKHPKRDLNEATRKSIARKNVHEKKDKSALNEKVAIFLECMVRDMKPIESIPFNEIFFFNNVHTLQAALIGDPRRRIQADLLESRNFLKCSCCKNGSGPLPSMHDTSIMYSLAQEHGDHINIHEWFNSFRAIVSPPCSQAKKRLKMSPSSKKRKSSKEPERRNDASIQAEFCRAVTELQITGLLRLPSKRRPDYVQRVAFGI